MFDKKRNSDFHTYRIQNKYLNLGVGYFQSNAKSIWYRSPTYYQMITILDLGEENRNTNCREDGDATTRECTRLIS